MTDAHKKLAAGAIVIAALTWWLATDPASPVRPRPPRPERPVLRFLGKLAVVAAKLGLGALVFLEPMPQDADEIQLSHAAIGTDGHQLLRNERW